MASGRAHHGLTVLIMLAAPAGMILTGQPIDAALAVGAGAFSGLLINPDLDVETGVKAHAVARKAGGCLLGGIWRAIWWPYAKLIRHRHPLSHWPVIGTIGRLAYLVGLMFILELVLQLFGIDFHMEILRIWCTKNLFYFAVLGLVLADLGHWILDFQGKKKLFGY